MTFRNKQYLKNKTPLERDIQSFLNTLETQKQSTTHAIEFIRKTITKKDTHVEDFIKRFEQEDLVLYIPNIIELKKIADQLRAVYGKTMRVEIFIKDTLRKLVQSNDSNELLLVNTLFPAEMSSIKDEGDIIIQDEEEDTFLDQEDIRIMQSDKNTLQSLIIDVTRQITNMPQDTVLSTQSIQKMNLIIDQAIAKDVDFNLIDHLSDLVQLLS